MQLNYKHWEEVKNGNFVVNLPFANGSTQYNVGDRFSKQDQPNIELLYETLMISEDLAEVVSEEEPKKSKRKK